MNILSIAVTYSCPFKCPFCYNKDKCNDNTLLDANVLNEFLSKNSNKFDKIYISGGEPSLLPQSYIESIYRIANTYSDVEIRSYPISNSYIIPKAMYNISYDFIARPRVRESWIKLLEFPQPFNITVTLSPLVFKYYPNKILQTFNMLKNLKKVEFKPYFKHAFSQFNIKSSEYKRFIQCVEESKLNLNYEIKFDDVFYGREVNEYILTPTGKLNAVQFLNDIRVEKEIEEKDIGKIKTNYPENIII